MTTKCPLHPSSSVSQISLRLSGLALPVSTTLDSVNFFHISAAANRFLNLGLFVFLSIHVDCVRLRACSVSSQSMWIDQSMWIE
jgi:hypothetical protein